MAGNGSGRSGSGRGMGATKTTRSSTARQARIQTIRVKAMVAAQKAEARAGLTPRIGDGKTGRQRLTDAKRRRALPEMQRNAAIQRIGRGDTMSDFMSRGNGNRARRRAGR